MSRVRSENKYLSFTGYSFFFLFFAGKEGIVFGRMGLWDLMIRLAMA